MLRYLQRAFGISKQSKPQGLTESQIETAHALVDAWGEYCEYHPSAPQITDENVLPFPKKALLNACLIVAGVEKDPERLNALRVCGPFLAYFQPDIGDKPLSPVGADLASLTSLVNSARDLGVELEGNTLLDAFAGADPANKERYDAMFPKVQEESAHIGELLDRVLQSRH